MISGAIYAAFELPGPKTERQGGILGAIPDDLPAVEAQRRAFAEFGVPLLTRTLVVSTYEGEQSLLEQGDLTRRVLNLVDRFQAQEQGFIAGLPVPEAVWPGSGGTDGQTVLVTYLLLDPELSVSRQLQAAARFRDALRDETGAQFAGVTGALQASEEQATIVDSHVHWIEGATLAIVFVILALRFRSIVAPVLTLLAGGVAYVAAMALLGEAQARFDLTLSSVVRPLLVVLIFGIVTDYAIFYLGSLRASLVGGHFGSGGAVWSTWRSVTPIVFVAAAIVLIGSLALLVAELDLVRSLAPALGLAVVLSFIVSVTFTPLMLAALGPAAFWPDNPRHERVASGLRGWSERQLVKRWVALPALLILGSGLVFAAFKVEDARLATNLIDDLPASSEAARAERLASTSIPDGAIAPTVLLLTGSNITADQSRLRRLEEMIRESPGVAAVAGPATDAGLIDAGVFRAQSGSAVRFLIVFDSDAYGSTAIGDYRVLAERLPHYLSQAGFDDARADFAGDTAISSQISGIALEDVLRVGAIVIILELAVLLLYLRSLLAPPLLLLITTLLLMASLGLTASISEAVLDQEALSFLVPIAAMVLLLSLGADYNLFLIGKVWSAQRSRPFTLALETAATESSSTILTAGLALTASFAILAVVPLASFRQIALAMSIGLLADTLLVRPLLVPALLATLRRLATWPAPRQQVEARPTHSEARSSEN